MSFKLRDLPYKINSLEPFISERTLDLHYNVHLNSYLENLNKLTKGTKFSNLSLERIIQVADGPVFNFAAQVWNHIFYFDTLKPDAKDEPSGSLKAGIIQSYGSVEFFKSTFMKAVDSFFGVGWVWLALNHNGSLEILPKNNAGNPLRIGYIPLMGCDVWEHAYYLDYQNRYDKYLNALWSITNWSLVEKRYNEALINLVDADDERSPESLNT